MTTNGHEPAVTNLGDVLARTKPTRTIRLPRKVDPGDITLFEMISIGRELGITPKEMPGLVDAMGWDAFELQQALVWVILRREEPELTWEQAQHFALDLEPDPDPPAPASAGASRRRGTTGSSTRCARPGSGPRKRAR